MAPQTQTQSSRPAKRTMTRRPGGNGHARRARRTGRTRQTRASQISELEQVIRSLEERISYLTSDRGIRSTVSGATSQVGHAVTRASDHVGDMVADTLTQVAGHLRGGATAATGAARTGASAMQKIGLEMERRPLMTVAVALGIGFLAGLAGRRDEHRA